MKKLLLIFLSLLLLQFAQAQKHVSKTGHIWFYSYTPIEEIEAHNRQVVGILDPSTGDLQFSLLIKSFEFQKALMQEHFNENYMESDKFPKSSFKGKLSDTGKIDFKKDGTYPAAASGELTIHGITKMVSATGTIEIKAGIITSMAKFSVAPKDYDIKIPAVVENNIAKSIDVTVEVTYTPNP